MIGFNHALTGAAIGLAVQQPLMVIPLAFVSHFVLDVVPHFGGHPIYEWGNKHFSKLIAFDAVLCIAGVGVALVFAPHAAISILLGVAFAMLPDLALVHYYTSGRHKHWFHDFHLGIQWFERPPGLLVEAVYLVFIGTALLALI